MIKSQYGVNVLNGGVFEQKNNSMVNSRSGSPNMYDLSKKRLNNSQMIDYDELSANILGSHEKHREKFDVMRKTHSKLN